MGANDRKPARTNVSIPTTQVTISKTTTVLSDGASDEFEFGGSLGTAALMLGFPLLMWYMWIGATYYDGQFPTPAPQESWPDFGRHLCHLVCEGAFPTAKAWAIDLAIRMVDLTTLEGQDTRGKVRALASKAMRPDPADPTCPAVAAVCVYGDMVATVKKTLGSSGVHVAAE